VFSRYEMCWRMRRWYVMSVRLLDGWLDGWIERERESERCEWRRATMQIPKRKRIQYEVA